MELQDEIMGYITLRDAHLSEQAWNTFSTWTKNEIAKKIVVENLKKLERPAVGRPGQTATLFATDDGNSYPLFEEEPEEEEVEAVQMVQSLFLTPENFFEEEGLYEELIDKGALYDEEVVYIAGDIPPSDVFEEEEAIAVCANWGQVRTYLHKQRLNRGFVLSLIHISEPTRPY